MPKLIVGTNRIGPKKKSGKGATAMQAQFEEGELVRFKTQDGSRVGEVIAVDERVLTVEWFGDGKRYKVQRNDATPFAQFLAQRKRPRKLKTVYAEFFGGRPMRRMPRKRLDALQRVLREHGVEFEKSRTRANDYFRMWMDPAHLTQRERKEWVPSVVLPDDVTAWLPKWLVTDPLPPSSRDPLGLQADAVRLADRLLPGLTVFTNRIGYFFFLAWAVRELNRHDGLTAGERRETLNRLERALVLCETLYHGKGDLKKCFHQGQRAKRRLLAEADLTAAIPDRILKNQHSTGCYNLYRTAMRSCGFWEDNDELGLAGRLPFRLTARGEKLASTFARRRGVGNLLKWTLDGTGRRKVRELQQWGESFCFCKFDRRSEKKSFLDGFLFAHDDRADVVCEADTRLQTLRTLAAEGLLFGAHPAKSTTTLVSSETVDADVTELEDAPDRGENVTFLLHFYRHRTLAGTGPFVASAVYELLGLALNAVWAGLLDHVIEHGRTSLTAWMDALIQESSRPQFWSASVETAASTVQMSEEQLAEQLFIGERKVEHGLMLAAKVLAREDNRVVLRERLANMVFQSLVNITFLSDTHKSVRKMLLRLSYQLIEHHRKVSERKSKERWLDTDGNDVWVVDSRLLAPDSRPMALGFHSYRFPQLMSLVQDLQLTEHELKGA